MFNRQNVVEMITEIHRRRDNNTRKAEMIVDKISDYLNRMRLEVSLSHIEYSNCWTQAYFGIEMDTLNKIVVHVSFDTNTVEFSVGGGTMGLDIMETTFYDCMGKALEVLMKK